MKIAPLLALASLLTPEAYRQSLYNSLDPSSVTMSLAFYELYSDTEEGRKALLQAERLLGGECPLQGITDCSQRALQAVISLVSRTSTIAEVSLSQDELQFIEKLGANLPNRKLKGFYAKTEEEILSLNPEEIDLGRALLLSQLGVFSKEIQTYEAMLDLMALQVKATFPDNPSGLEKIRALNTFVFEKMHFRFPPHSLYAKDVDLYTFLPSVLDNHLGVCLGVTTLYLALAQRIDLPLTVITPPGHIFVSYSEGESITNIETTARGIHFPLEHYLSFTQCFLQTRNYKEVIGFTHFNQASVFLQREEYEKAVAAYEKALPYLQDDALVLELLGFSYLFIGEEEKGRSLLQKVSGKIFEGSLVAESRASDYLEGKVDHEGLKAIFLGVDEERESILAKQAVLKEVLQRYPEFREGLIQLAVSYLQLNKTKEALAILQKHHAIDPNDPTVEYYLSVIYAERKDYVHALEHLKNVERITANQKSEKKALEELKRKLYMHYPA